MCASLFDLHELYLKLYRIVNFRIGYNEIFTFYGKNSNDLSFILPSFVGDFRFEASYSVLLNYIFKFFSH